MAVTKVAWSEYEMVTFVKKGLKRYECDVCKQLIEVGTSRYVIRKRNYPFNSARHQCENCYLKLQMIKELRK